MDLHKLAQLKAQFLMWHQLVTNVVWLAPETIWAYMKDVWATCSEDERAVTHFVTSVLFRLTETCTLRLAGTQGFSTDGRGIKRTSCCMTTACWVDVAASLWFQRVVDHRQTRFPASDTVTAECLINGSVDLSLVTVSVQREPLQSATFTSVQMFRPQSIRLLKFLWHPFFFLQGTKMLLCHLLLALRHQTEKN